MSTSLRELAALYVSVALLLTVGFVLLRATLWLMGRLGLHLSARQTLRAGRVTLALALLLPPACLALRGLVPTGPLFTFDRSVVRHTARLPEPAWLSGGRAAPARPASETGLRDAGELARAGHLNDYVSTVQAGLLILRNPHLLD